MFGSFDNVISSMACLILVDENEVGQALRIRRQIRRQGLRQIQLEAKISTMNGIFSGLCLMKKTLTVFFNEKAYSKTRTRVSTCEK